MAENDLKAAQRSFRLATNTQEMRIRNHALLRLGDIEIRLGGPKAKGRAVEMYERVDERDACFAGMVALRKALLDTKDIERTESGIMKMVEKPTCTPQAIEARYAMSRISSKREQFEFALRLLEEAKSMHATEWGSRATFKALAGIVANEAISRLFRERKWDGLASLYRTRLKARQKMLRPDSCLMVARALNRVGLHVPAAELLHAVLKRKPAPANIDDLTVELAKSYVRGGKTYQAEIVLDYFRRARSRSKSYGSSSIVAPRFY